MLSRRSHPTPGDTPLSFCGCSRPGACILSPASPARNSPLPAFRVPLSPRGPFLFPRPPPEPVQPSCFAGSLCSGILVATRFQIGQEARRRAGHRGQRPARSPVRQPRLPPASLGSPGLSALAPPPNNLTNLLAGRQEGAAVSGGGPASASAPLSAGLGGAAGAALLRPRGEWAQPDAARLCLRCLRRATERFQTCSVPRPARVGCTKSQPRRGRRSGARRACSQPEATTVEAEEEGGAVLLKIAPAEAKAGIQATHPHSSAWGSRSGSRVPARTMTALCTPPGANRAFFAGTPGFRLS